VKKEGLEKRPVFFFVVVSHLRYFMWHFQKSEPSYRIHVHARACSWSVIALIVIGYVAVQHVSPLEVFSKATAVATGRAPRNQLHASASPLPIGRIIFISYIDEELKHTSGSTSGAQSRTCYASMHANYTVLQYTDSDFKGWMPTSTNRSEKYNPATDAYHRARYYSKLIFVNRTMFEQGMAEHDWVFWMDSDTIITNPAITAESIIREACIDHRARLNNSISVKLRDLIVANTPNGINNGVFAMRNTAWSRRFLQRWWDDGFGSTDHAFDNGPFMHAVLREMALRRHGSAAAEYDGACDGRIHPDKIMGGWTPFWDCYRHYVRRRLCSEADKFECMSRCPNSDQADAEAWTGSVADDAQNLDRLSIFGSITEGHDHIGGHCHINLGFGWGPTADWSKDTSWLLHLAGQSAEERKRVMSRVAPTVSNRFSPPCSFL